MTQTVIIDADVLVYKTAEAIEDYFKIISEEDTDEFIYRTIGHGDKVKAKQYIERKVDSICVKTQSTNVVMVLSDAEANFRKDLLPSYKGNRKSCKPILYKWLREYIHKNYNTFERPTLEGDDVMGILVTFPKPIKGVPSGKKVLWSMDKDFKTIPCTFYREAPDGKITKQVMTQAQADYNWMTQTLTGDPVDGYKGCPDFGKTRAAELLTPKMGSFDLDIAWKKVIDAYVGKGLTEEDALVQARCARILRAEDYDFSKKEVKLWNQHIID